MGIIVLAPQSAAGAALRERGGPRAVFLVGLFVAVLLEVILAWRGIALFKNDRD